MAKRKVYCITPGCMDERKYVQSGLCGACYHGMNYWKGASPTRIVKRMKQLDRLRNRMDMLAPNVKTIRRRRRA